MARKNTLYGETEKKFLKLLEWFRGYNSALVALSGGVDSSLAAAAAHRVLGERAVAVTANSVTLAPWELADTKRVAEYIGIKHMIIEYDELGNKRLARNPPDRCYHCRNSLALHLKQMALEHGLEVIVDGTIIDDFGEHRPGVSALNEAGVRHPLAEAGLGKKEVREIALHLGLPTACKPSNACLASRFPYGRRITRGAVARVAEAEKFLRELVGVRQVRVRSHGDIARIEVGREERNLLYDGALMDAVDKRLKELGYKYVAMDLQGYRSGSMDEVLASKVTLDEPSPLPRT